MLTSSLERKVLGGLGLASIIIAGVTLSYHICTEHLVASGGRAIQSQALRAAVGELAKELDDARTAARGFAEKRDPDLLSIYQSSQHDIQQTLARMHVSAGDLHRKQSVQLIDKMVRKRLVEFDGIVGLGRESDASARAKPTSSPVEADADAMIAQRIDLLEQETRREVAHRQRISEASHAIMLAILLLGGVVELAFAVAAAGVVRRDVAERRRASEAVEQSERVLRSFYESGVTMMGMVELLDDDVLHVSDNSATGEYFGRDPSELAGKTSTQLGAPRKCIDMWIEKYRHSAERCGPVQFEYESNMGGRRRWLSAVVCPIQRPSASGRAQFSYVILDVTARKEAEIELNRHADELFAAKQTLERQSEDLDRARCAADAANEAKSNFLANMSHEIRTPMTAVLGYSDLLAESGRSDAERSEWVGVIRRNARHLLELINDILDLSKIEAGQMTVERVPCDVSAVIDEVIDMMMPRAREKNIQLQRDEDAPLPPRIAIDPLRLRQVLVNLVGNALKFTEAGEVVVHAVCRSTGAETGNLHISVRDTGIGMTAAQLDRLFRPFTQADETTTRRFGGTGLGLTISHRLVQLMGGTLVAQSEAGLGSTFRIELPIVEARAEEPQTVRVDEPEAQRRRDPVRGRILLVEDAPDVQRLTSFLLRRLGAEVVVASNGREAVDAASRERFDLILMDMQMPVLDGYGAATELRRRGNEVPIIAVTAHAMTGDRERCLNAGCNDYLTKPIDQGSLVGVLKRYLGRDRVEARTLVA